MTRDEWELVAVPLEPVWCPENSDGTFSWPWPNGAYSAMRSSSDVPDAYQRPPLAWRNRRTGETRDAR